MLRLLPITNGKVVAVGSNDDILGMANGSTKKMDIGGKTITPGFVDAHSHPGSSGRSHLRQVDCDLRSIDAIKQAIKEKQIIPNRDSGSADSNMTTPRLLTAVTSLAMIWTKLPRTTQSSLLTVVGIRRM